MSTYEAGTLTVSVISLIVSASVMGLLIWQLRLLRRQVDDARTSLDISTSQAASENLRVRQSETLKFVATTLPEQNNLLNDVPQHESDVRYTGFLESALVPDSDNFHKLRRLMSYYEMLSAAVNMDVFDYAIIDRTMGARVKRTHRMYKPWVKAERIRLNRVRLYEELEMLATRLVEES
ncbi:hypothetical protein Aple_074220 [Acrocarpospora pleiomorpha]|uniref:DUF4760 domain-containing protein n=1 Tax=Acrocarpospora pleiomorpha TaxID=90975 RepID=A0A5M3XYG5_9ACTN|nr:DUF4760 domain-containing protein [Acrocarpospora pleiomorpha]GES24523.1 hypothetical protein Aple_074220 [Acrocarpospora pleiomorpha]